MFLFQKLIELGATDLLVPGVLPIGCFPVYLTLYNTSNKADYNARTGCLRRYNRLAFHHNRELKQQLDELQKKYPKTKIMYGDYFKAAMQFIVYPGKFGEFSLFFVTCYASPVYLGASKEFQTAFLSWNLQRKHMICRLKPLFACNLILWFRFFLFHEMNILSYFRFQHGFASMLRRGRAGQLQLQPEEEVWRAGRKRVLQPVVVRELGRHPHDWSCIQEGRRWLVEWPVCWTPDSQVIIEIANLYVTPPQLLRLEIWGVFQAIDKICSGSQVTVKLWVK